MTWARAAVMIRWSSFAVSGPMEIRNSSMRAAISAWGRLFITCHSRSERRSYSARTACSAGSIISPEGRRGVARKMSECETRPRLVRDDGGAGDVAFVLLDEGLLDRFQGEFVGDDLLPRIALPGARHHVEGAAQVLGLVVGESEDAAVAEDDPGGSNSAFQPTLMLPISRYVPSGAVMRRPSSTTLGLPTSSITMSPPQSSVSFFTALMRSSGVGCSRMSTTSVAPKERARARRSSTPSMMITRAAPISRATAHA